MGTKNPPLVDVLPDKPLADHSAQLAHIRARHGLARHAPGQRVVESFLQGKSENTLAAYSRDLNKFAAWLRAEDRVQAVEALLSLPHGEANELAGIYRGDMLAQGLSPATINRRLTCLRQVVAIGNMLGIISWKLMVPAIEAEKYRETAGPGIEAVREMFAALDDGRLIRRDKNGHPLPSSERLNTRNRALLALLYDLALRRSAVCSLDMEHLDMDAGTAMVKIKGRHAREKKVLPEVTQRELKKWLEVRGPSPGAVFTGRGGKGRLTPSAIWRIIKSLGKAVGIRTWPHGLRHTAITDLLDQSDGNIRMAQEFSGHKNPATLQIYDDHRMAAGAKAAEMVATNRKQQLSKEEKNDSD